jgi:hypothetical protein
MSLVVGPPNQHFKFAIAGAPGDAHFAREEVLPEFGMREFAME